MRDLSLFVIYYVLNHLYHFGLLDIYFVLWVMIQYYFISLFNIDPIFKCKMQNYTTSEENVEKSMRPCLVMSFRYHTKSMIHERKK